ncbi:MAG: hypothetical protein ABI461_23905 [Polyangiaceae bacterium]
MNVLLHDQNGAPVSLPSDIFLQEVTYGRVPRDLPTSIDGGKVWIPAWQLDQKLRARGSDDEALLMPKSTEAWSAVAGYLALFSLLFFGGPLSLGAAILSWDSGPKRLVRLGFVIAALLLGAAPIAGMAELGRRALSADPILRGRGRMIFAMVVAAILVVPCVIGLFGVVLR